MGTPESKPTAKQIEVESGKVVEVKPISVLSKTVATLLRTVERIGGVKDAQRTLAAAKIELRNGKPGEAKKLAMAVFGRLDRLGKKSDSLTIDDIQDMLQGNKEVNLAHGKKDKHEELAQVLKDERDRLLVPNDPALEKLIKRVESVGGELSSEDVQKMLKEKKSVELANKLNKQRLDNKMPDPSGNIVKMIRRVRAGGEISLDTINDFIESNKVAREAVLATELSDYISANNIDAEEARLHKELEGFLEKINTRAKFKTDQELKDARGELKSGLKGELHVSEEIDKVGSHVEQFLKQKVESVRADREGSEKKVNKTLKKKRKGGVLEAIAERIITPEPVKDRIFLAKLETLTGGLKKIKEETARGMSLYDSVKTLSNEEIRQIRSMLSTLKEYPEGKEPAYFDEQYLELTKGFRDNEVGKGIEDLFTTIDLTYSEMQINTGDIRVGGAIKKLETTSQKEIVDEIVRPNVMGPDGQTPMFGSELSAPMDKDGIKKLYEVYGEQRFFEYFEDDGMGGFRARNFDAVQQENRIREQIHRYGTLEQRESFQNISMKQLKDYMRRLESNPRNPKVVDMIDWDYYEVNGVAKLKQEIVNSPEKKKIFEDWWVQEVFFEQRNLAYEGLFDKRGSSIRMTRLNSLNEIIGVGTEKKGLAVQHAMSFSLIDAQNNSYVNDEFMDKMAGFWANQGPSFRLESMMKEHREIIYLMNKENGEKGEKLGDVNVYDSINLLTKKLGRTTPEDIALRAALGVPDWWDGTIGTLYFKNSEAGQKEKFGKEIWRYFYKTRINPVGQASGNVRQGFIAPNSAEENSIFNRYSNILDYGFQFATVHKSLNQMLGNASFEKNQFEFPQGVAEMHVKLDPILYRFFGLKYSIGGALKEFWALFDPGVRDYVAMAPKDYVGHLHNFIDKEILAKIRNAATPAEKQNLIDSVQVRMSNGARTIMSTFFGVKPKGEVIPGEPRIELDMDIIDASEELQGIFKKALWNNGKHGKPRHGHEMDAFKLWGKEGDQNTAFRNSPSETAAILADPLNRPSHKTLEMIEWGDFVTIVKRPDLTEKLYGKTVNGVHIESSMSYEDRWDLFVKEFGEDYIDHDSPSAKRTGDLPKKYGVAKILDYVKAFLAVQQEPWNVDKTNQLWQTPVDVNAAAVPGIVEKHIDYMYELNEAMGPSWAGGKSAESLKRTADGAVMFDTSEGNEYPMPMVETFKNDTLPFSKFDKSSIMAKVGVGNVKDPLVIIEALKGWRAVGKLSDRLYEKKYNKVMKGMWIEPKLGPIYNFYRILSMDPLFEVLGAKFHISGHELKHILEENTEKTVEKLWHNLNTVGGGGGH